MQASDFDYQLPQRLIAHHPPPQRSGSRLLCLDVESGRRQHRQFAQLPDCLRAGDLLVFNDSRVIPARLVGSKESGGRCEVLIERLLTGSRVLAQVSANRPPGAGSRLLLEAAASPEESDAAPDLVVQVLGRDGDFFRLQFPPRPPLLTLLKRYGRIPLPPYIKRPLQPRDRERYQTVYARNDGAVAAPTAGLHFDQAMLETISARGIARTFLTLHVGAGTFQPLRVDRVEDHSMHRERIEVGEGSCAAINACRKRGGRVIAVGTTTVRALESACRGGRLQPCCEDTDLFIYPGFDFRVVDAMITNFHLPRSTLLMLVSAFCSRDMLMAAYQEAIAREYRFFSYGDAMFLYRPTN